MSRTIVNWWPVPVMLALIVAVQVMWSGDYDVSGHAAEHFSSATVIFGVSFLAAIIVWAAPGTVRRRPELWLLIAAVLAAALLVTVGNIRVVDAIGSRDWSVEQAEEVGPQVPGFRAGHDLAQRAAYAVIVSVVALAAWLWWRRAVRRGVAVSAILLSITLPYWVFPGAGIAVLAGAGAVARARRLAPRAHVEPPSAG